MNENCTYIQNPSFPTGDTNENTVSYTVEKCSNGGKTFNFPTLKKNTIAFINFSRVLLEARL